MAGLIGPLRLEGPLSRLAPWLSLASTCNIGSHASLGLGWFELEMEE
jgi:CRISPR/Cas system endoribonuclease Cas6 (RAMP superfamily)